MSLVLLVLVALGVPASAAALRRWVSRRAQEAVADVPRLRDGLTRLPSREWLEGRIDQALAQAVRDGCLVGVLVLDVDRLATVNDHMGREWGDRVLVETGRRLQLLARTEDTVARLDGDQFAVLLEHLSDANTAVRVAKRIVEEFRSPLELGEEGVVVSLSIGVAVSGAELASGHDLLRDGAFALGRAKGKGRGRFEIFDSRLRDRAMNRLSLEARMSEAVSEGELILHYQPEVVLDTGEIVGVEALIRWRHPTLGLLVPDQFVGIAEETGLIVPIGRWVLEEACAATARLERRGLIGPSFRVNVNVSVRQLQNDLEFLEHTATVLAQSNVAPRRLTLEITETFEAIESVSSALERLRVAGVGVALDDFGTGYSSLSRLTSLPINVIKIDQRFVRGIGDPANLAIVRSVPELGGALGMTVTAEGVETSRQLQLVQSARCTRGQGFFFSRPLAEPALWKLLEAGPRIAKRRARQPSAERRPRVPSPR
jgi:diguanylate cyclase (GGDEF)-like protein